MTKATKAIVYFTCKECGMTYTVTQESRPDGHSGKFDCVDCGKTVLEWTGFHSFDEWEPVVAVEGNRTIEIKCPACNGTGFAAAKKSAPGRRIYPPKCAKCGGKGRINKADR